MLLSPLFSNHYSEDFDFVSVEFLSKIPVLMRCVSFVNLKTVDAVLSYYSEFQYNRNPRAFLKYE